MGLTAVPRRPRPINPISRSADQPNRKFSHSFYGPYVFFARTPTSGVKRTMLTTQRNVR